MLKRIRQYKGFKIYLNTEFEQDRSQYQYACFIPGETPETGRPEWKDDNMQGIIDFIDGGDE